MILYRCINNDELLSMINGDYDNVDHSIRGENTFTYDKKTEYRHFFVFADHAAYYRDEKSHHLYPIIGQYIIPNEIIDQYGFGLYSNVKTMRNDKLRSTYIPLPEIIVKELYFDRSFLYKVESELYSDFITKKLNRKDNEKYGEKIEEYFLYDGCGKHGISGYLDYSYADVYYEMIYKLARENNMNINKVISKLNPYTLSEDIECFFEKNSGYFKNETKQYLKNRKKA